ncbi:Putative 2-acylglycerophosphoethanolamine acyltransferase / acyl-acyl carrier protein synthetase [hydrothermal vent metagenome]|uniref:Putative 2-acylglycerophosphoethanolamine acyltransferase / acyl-acyl carrier protein synthetase n=1 Tax=hydrothermal vent metagenome TaxID=652676 RepID=A0A1W1BQ25_9ZZZZ
MKNMLLIRGFIPYLLILLINATVDIGHKITIQNVLLKSFDGDILIILSALINAMILLPFIFLFSPSGYISDKYSKSLIIRYSSIVAVFIAILITISYYQGWFLVSFGLTFLLAMQSAVYSPAKYGLIKELVGIKYLGTANGLVQAITIIAILFSSIIFSIIFEFNYGGFKTPHEILPNLMIIGWILIGLTIIEAILSFRLPIFEVKDFKGNFSLNSYFKLDYFKSNIKIIRENRNIWLSIFGLGVFWGVGQLLIASFPAHYKMMTGDENAIIIQSILAVSAIGITIGSIVAGRLSYLHIELGIVPLGALGIFLSLIFFAFSSTITFMVISSISFGFFGGLLIVPLNATIQFFAKKSQMGIVLAGNNFIQNILMFIFLALTIIFVKIGFSSTSLFLFASVITLVGSLYAMRELPNLFVRLLLVPLIHSRYKVHIRGLENLPQEGGVLLLGNHISWIDWMILQLASPRAIKFVMEKSIYNKWYLKWFLKHFKIIPISGTSSRGAISQIRDRLDNGEVVALFPEGMISYNGQLNEFKRGFELSLKGTNHPIIPFYIHGLWGSTFSRADDNYKIMSKNGKKRHIVVALGKKMPSNSTTIEVKQAVSALSFLTWEERISDSKPLQYSWIKRAKSNLKERSVVDAMGSDLTNAKMITAVLLFVKYLKISLKDKKNIGLLLPASSIGSILNMSLFVLGKRPINLNYTLSKEAMASALDKADIQVVIGSDKFMQKLSAKGFSFDEVIGDKFVSVESIGATFNKFDKISALLKSYLMPRFLIELCYFEKVSIDDTATILFSSGSEGTPKGIELTHKNLMANIQQVSALINFQDKDVILNSLPIFHSFGLTITTLLPLCEGITMVSAPDPTDALGIGKLSARYNATIMFGTATFFRLYAKNRKLHPLMFDSIRMIVAGAEKLKPEIKSSFKEKFSKDIFEGYGATETSPVISVNMPDSLDLDSMRPIIGNKVGSVGQAIGGTIVKIVDPLTMSTLPVGEDGLIIVGGSQVMKGYLNDKEKTDEVIVEIDGIRYYKTGDKGHIDEDGFIYIVDRYSRFAKIGGEMISLGSVEEMLGDIFLDSVEIMAVALPDDKKGEQIILIYTSDLEEKEILLKIKESDILPIMKPSKLFKVELLPKLGTGKADFKGAKSLAKELMAKSNIKI